MDLRSLHYFVVVAQERNFRRAAARLYMTQPPLSRAVKQLEVELGVVLLNRTASGVSVTPAGAVLFKEARTLLARAERVRSRVVARAATARLTIGVLADSAAPAGSELAVAFRAEHPHVDVRIREADLTDPTTGLRSGLVDVALTRTPFDDTGITTRVIRTDAVGAVLRTDDSLADRASLTCSELDDRPWFRMPEDTDPIWRAYWTSSAYGEGPEIRTVQECLQAVLWSGAVGVTLLGHDLPDGLCAVPLVDMRPSQLVVAWPSGDTNPLVGSFARIATRILGPLSGSPVAPHSPPRSILRP